jgi:THO complex subunit 2
LQQGAQQDEAIKKELEKLVSKVFLPSLCLIPSNPGFSYELWELLKQLPYITRYRLYGEWRNVAFTKYPELVRSKITSTSDIKKLLRFALGLIKD